MARKTGARGFVRALILLLVVSTTATGCAFNQGAAGPRPLRASAHGATGAGELGLAAHDDSPLGTCLAGSHEPGAHKVRHNGGLIALGCFLIIGAVIIDLLILPIMIYHHDEFFCCRAVHRHCW